MQFKKTIEVVRTLGIPYSRVADLIRHLKIPPPSKDASGDYIWSEEDVARARTAIANTRPRGRPRKVVLREA